jgi:hypothetical protein
MSLEGHSRPGPAGRRFSHVRYAPKATVGHQNALGRDGPDSDIPHRERITQTFGDNRLRRWTISRSDLAKLLRLADRGLPNLAEIAQRPGEVVPAHV